VNEKLDIDLLTTIFSDIVDGYSELNVNNTIYYFKHPTLKESFRQISMYEKFVQEGISVGLRKEKECIKEAISGGWWQKDNEERISLLTTTIANLRKTQQKLLYDSQKRSMEDQINKNNYILTSLLKDRGEIVGFTCEKYANQKYIRSVLEESIFVDRSCSKYLFDPGSDDYYEFDTDFIDDVTSKYNLVSSHFDLKNIKTIAASGFFQNLIFSCEDSMCFWGEPIVNLSKYKNDLFLYGKIYRGAIKSQAEIGKPINEEILKDPEKLISFVENNNKSGGQSGIRRKSKNSGVNNNVSSYVGATKDDLDGLGVKVEKLGGKSLLQMAREKGGVIEKNDYLSVREKS
jgi:hypothetical protein